MHSGRQVALLRDQFKSERNSLCTQIEKLSKQAYDLMMKDLISNCKSEQDMNVKMYSSFEVDNLIQEYEDKIKLLKQEKDCIEETNCEYSISIKENRKEIVLKDREIFALKSLIAKNVQDMDGKDEEIIESHKLLREAEENLDKLENENEKLKQQQIQLMEQFEMECQSSGECNELEEIKSQLNDTEKQLQELLTAEKNSREEIEKLKQTIEKQTNDIIEYQKQKTDLESKLESIQIENKKLSDSLEVVEQREKDVIQSHEETKKELETTKKKLEETETSLNDLLKKRRTSSWHSSQDSPPCKKMKTQSIVVVFSGFKDNSTKKKLQGMITQLNGKVSDKIGPKATHLVIPSNCRTLKTLAASLLGLWIVSPAWVNDSHKLSEFQNESVYGNQLLTSPFANKNIYLAPVFKKDAVRAKVCKELLVQHGKGNIIENHNEADIIVVSSSESRSGYQSTCVTWSELLDMIPSTSIKI